MEEALAGCLDLSGTYGRKLNLLHTEVLAMARAQRDSASPDSAWPRTAQGASRAP